MAVLFFAPPLRASAAGSIMSAEETMLAYTYFDKGDFRLIRKPRPSIVNDTDAIVRVTLSSICTSDLHIMHGSVPRAVKGVTVGHEGVGEVVEVGKKVRRVRAGERVSINVETFCGECWFCKRGYVNNCTSPDGGWAMGCRIDGMQAEYVRVPFADSGLTAIPGNVTDKQALLVGDILATGYWATRISEIEKGDDILVIGAGPTGICCALSALTKNPNRVFICDIDRLRLDFVQKHYPALIPLQAADALGAVLSACPRGGADRVIEAAGTPESFRLAWQAARPNTVVTVVAMYDAPQVLPLPDMYGKNLTFKTGGVDGCDAREILSLVSEGKLDVSALITHTFPLSAADEAYRLFAAKQDGVMKVALDCRA